MTVGSKFNLIKEEIRLAMTESKILVGYKEDGDPVFEVAEKEECVKRVLYLVDFFAHECIQAYSSARTMETLLKELAGEKAITDHFQRYMEVADSESKKYDDYDYEDLEETIEERKGKRPFQVIDGGKL